jgi:hypothetical protein
MLMSSDSTWINCPYCGARIELVIDDSIPFQEYIEDCEVCCRPMVLAVSVDEAEGISVEARNENEV